jgi:hypothetical protein
MPRKITTSKPSAMRTKKPGRQVGDKLVESSALANHRRRGEFPTKAKTPTQPKIRKTPPRKAPPSTKTHEGLSKEAAKLREQREKVSAEVVAAAAATGMLPHEWLLAVMRGEQINHYAYDSDSQEIVEVIVLPTFADRMEAAKSAAPYFSTRLSSPKGDAGKPHDPMKQRGVMEVPLVDSMERWAEIAQQSQTLLKKEVTK